MTTTDATHADDALTPDERSVLVADILAAFPDLTDAEAQRALDKVCVCGPRGGVEVDCG